MSDAVSVHSLIFKLFSSLPTVHGKKDKYCVCPVLHGGPKYM